MSTAFEVMCAGICSQTDCSHSSTYTCSGWAEAEDAFQALTEAGFAVVHASEQASATQRLTEIQELVERTEEGGEDSVSLDELRAILDATALRPHRFQSGQCLDCELPAAMHDENGQPVRD